MGALCSKRLDAHPPHGVDGHLRRSSRRRPRDKARDLAHEKRIAPRQRVRRGDLSRSIELTAPQRLRDGVAHRERPLPHFEDERGLG